MEFENTAGAEVVEAATVADVMEERVALAAAGGALAAAGAART